MGFTCCRFLPTLVVYGIFAAASCEAHGAAVPSAAATYPQIVRISYVEGDVRISRGKLADKADEAAGGKPTGWEQAKADVSLASGYSLVTGKGRAEIELEDASTLYLGEDSVLAFNELTATGGVPYTEVALLSGVMTVNLRTTVPGEIFRLATPADHATFSYPQRAAFRVNSYLDGIAVTALPALGRPWYEPGAGESAGQTRFYRTQVRQIPPKSYDPSAFKDWDAWVTQRVQSRNAAISATMREAGLSSPIPGLAEMSGQGHFFACQPYGTCWEPTHGWNGAAAGPADSAGSPPELASAGTASPLQAQPAQADGHASVVTGDRSQDHTSSAPQTSPATSAATAYLAAHPGATFAVEEYDFPCSIAGVSELVATDPITGKQTVVESSFLTGGIGFRFAGYPRRFRSFPLFALDDYDAPWDWAVCHSGAWIRWQHHYVWVVGTKRHHRHPVRWVKRGHEVGFVPVHPRDVTGKPPLNLKDGLFLLTGKKDHPIERAVLDDGQSVKLLGQTPKEFVKPELEPLEIAEVPHPEAYTVFRAENLPAGRSATTSTGTKSTGIRGTGAAEHGTAILFDRKTQSFSVAREANGGVRSGSETLGGGRTASYQNGFANAQGRATSGGSYSGNTGSGARASSYSGGSSGASGGGYSRASAPAPSYSAPVSAPSARANSSSSSGGGSGRR